MVTHSPTSPTADSPHGKRQIGIDFRPVIYGTILLVSAVAIYSNCFQGKFVLDDRGPSILNNPTIQHLQRLDLVLKPPSDATVTSRPLLNLSLALNYGLEGVESTVGYHLINVVIHAANCLLIFGLVRRTLMGPRLANQFNDHAASIAFACALIWVTHPLCTSCVTYIVQRAESLMTLFLLCTLYCSIRAEQPTKNSGAWIVTAIIACALGMASKEIMAIAPLLVILYDWVFGTERFSDQRVRRGHFYLCLAATWVVLYAAMSTGTRHSVGFNFLGDHPLIPVTSWEYARTQAPIIVHYLRLAVWPYPLVFDYDWPIARQTMEWLPYLFIVALLGLASVWGAWRRYPIGFLGVLFFVMLAPSSSFLVIFKEVAAEHRMYLPLATVIVALVCGLSSLESAFLERFNLPIQVGRYTGWIIVVLIAATFSTITYHRNSIFHDRFLLWKVTAEHAERGARPHYNLAMQYGRKADELREEAQQMIKNGKMADAQSNFDTANQFIEEKFSLLHRAIELKPAYPNAHYSLALELQKRGESEDAIRSYRRAIKFYGARTDPQSHNNLGLLLSEQGKQEEAIRHFRISIGAQPSNFRAHYNYANSLIASGEYVQAKNSLQQAVNVNGKYRKAWTRLAELMATAPVKAARDGKKSLALAKNLIESSPQKDPFELEILAAALAEVDSFDQAAHIAGQLVNIYRDNHIDRWKIMEHRRREYRAGRAVYMTRPDG